ncbi:MAG: hypothetical protein K2N48_08645 [Muribaculaceae bacterium]|nr:hypothetical protein [Muribaculaceae bacterium]
MKKFSNLVIEAGHEELVEMLRTLKRTPSNTFIYEPELSNDYAANIFRKPDETACFKVIGDWAYGSSIWMYITDDLLRVANIVPKEANRLTISQYNLIMSRFFHDFVAKVINEKYAVFIDGDNLNIENILPSDTYRKLMQWEETCNQDYPISHGMDEEKWFAFLVSIFQNDVDLSPSDLVTWLQEDCGWRMSYRPERFAELKYAYEYGLSLLKYADSHDHHR